MAKTWFIGETLNEFPENDFGGEGDFVINEITGEAQKKVSGIWETLSTGDTMQFIENASDTPTSNPTDPTKPAIYLGNVDGTYYVWSIVNAAWIPISSV